MQPALPHPRPGPPTPSLCGQLRKGCCDGGRGVCESQSLESKASQASIQPGQLCMCTPDASTAETPSANKDATPGSRGGHGLRKMPSEPTKYVVLATCPSTTVKLTCP